MAWIIACILLALLCLFLLIRQKRRERAILRLIIQMNQVLNQAGDSDILMTTQDKALRDFTLSLNYIISRYRKAEEESKRHTGDLRHSISRLSHDLRTPLTSALGYVQMLRLGHAGEDSEEARRLAIVEERLESLHRLLEQLFQYVRAEDIGDELTLVRTPVDNLLRDQFALYYEQLQNRGLALDLALNAEREVLFLNPDAMDRVFANLMQNLLRYADRFAGVYSFAEHEKVHLIFYNGLSPETEAGLAKLAKNNSLDVLLERFQVLDASRTRGSTGLGLAIVKRWIERMHGTVTVRLKTPEEPPLLPPGEHSPLAFARRETLFVIDICF